LWDGMTELTTFSPQVQDNHEDSDHVVTENRVLYVVDLIHEHRGDLKKRSAYYLSRALGHWYMFCIRQGS